MKSNYFSQCRHPNFCRTDFCLMTVGAGRVEGVQRGPGPPDGRQSGSASGGQNLHVFRPVYLFSVPRIPVNFSIY